jgi:hypothetical protein
MFVVGIAVVPKLEIIGEVDDVDVESIVLAF